MVAIISLACRLRGGMLESSEVLLLASVGPERGRVGWLDLLNNRAKGMLMVLHEKQQTAAQKTPGTLNG
jgi:hypothetical protein